MEFLTKLLNISKDKFKNLSLIFSFSSIMKTIYLITNLYIISFAISLTFNFKYTFFKVNGNYIYVFFSIFLVTCLYIINFNTFKIIIKKFFYLFIFIFFITVFHPIILLNLYILMLNFNSSSYRICFLILSFAYIIGYKFCKYTHIKIEKEEELFKERKEEVEFIKLKLENCNILGIDGNWGIGKTFLINEIKKQYDADYIFISMLNLEGKEIIPFILNQMNKVLQKNGIFTFYSKKIIKIISNQSFKNINFVNIFSSSETLKELIEEYKKVLKTLPRELIIIFDDLDRINNIEKIEQVLNFGVDFEQDKIKFIYIYSQKELNKIGNRKFNRKYIEKFIPYIHTISYLNFNQIFEHLFDTSYKNNDILEKKDFNFLIKIFDKDFFGEENKKELGTINDLKYIFGVHKNYLDLSFLYEEINPRKVKLFLDEVILILQLKKENNLDIENRVIIAFCFLKVFLYEEYLKLEKLDDIYKLFPVNYSLNREKEQSITLDELDFNNFILKNKKIFAYIYNKKATIIMGMHNEYFYEESEKNWKNYTIEKFSKFFNIPITIDFVKNKLIVKEDYFNKYAFSNLLNENIHIKDTESIKNLFIRVLFNSYLMSASETITEYSERKDRLENNLKKLFNTTNNEYLSIYQGIYKELKSIFSNSEEKVKMEQYDNFLKSDEKITRPIYLDILNTLDVLGNNYEKLEYLILETNIRGKITDEIIDIIYISRCLLEKNLNLKIINLFKSEEIDIINIKFIKNLLKQEIAFINSELVEEFFYGDDLIKNQEDFKNYIAEIIKKLEDYIEKNKLFYDNLEELKIFLNTTIDFFNKIKEISIDIKEIKDSNLKIKIKEEYLFQELLKECEEKDTTTIFEILNNKLKSGSMTIQQAINFHKKLENGKNEGI